MRDRGCCPFQRASRRLLLLNNEIIKELLRIAEERLCALRVSRFVVADGFDKLSFFGSKTPSCLGSLCDTLRLFYLYAAKVVHICVLGKSSHVLLYECLYYLLFFSPAIFAISAGLRNKAPSTFCSAVAPFSTPTID